MQHTPLSSTMLESAGFENGVLEIKFRTTGKYYKYAGTQGIFDDLIAAESPGKYFGANIKGKLSVITGVQTYSPLPQERPAAQPPQIITYPPVQEGVKGDFNSEEIDI